MVAVTDHVVDLVALERRWLAAIVTADRDDLELLHGPGFVLCTPSGGIWDRARYVGGLLDGSIDYRTFEPITPIETLLDAELAVVRYRSRIELSIGGRPPGTLECCHLDVYRRAPCGTWQCHWSQATDTIP